MYWERRAGYLAVMYCSDDAQHAIQDAGNEVEKAIGDEIVSPHVGDTMQRPSHSMQVVPTPMAMDLDRVSLHECLEGLGGDAETLAPKIAAHLPQVIADLGVCLITSCAAVCVWCV